MPFAALQIVPVFVHTKFAAPAALVGVSIIVSATPASFADVVTLMMPSVTEVTAVMLLVTAMVGTPLAAALQPVKVPKVLKHSAIAIFVLEISDIALLALARDV